MNLSITRLMPAQKINYLQKDDRTSHQDEAIKPSLSGLQKDALSISFTGRARKLMKKIAQLKTQPFENTDFNLNDIISEIKAASAGLLDPKCRSYPSRVACIKHLMYRNDDADIVKTIDAFFDYCPTGHLIELLRNKIMYSPYGYPLGYCHHAKALTNFLKRLNTEGIKQPELQEILESNNLCNPTKSKDVKNIPGLIINHYNKFCDDCSKDKALVEALGKDVKELEQTLKRFGLVAKFGDLQTK